MLKKRSFFERLTGGIRLDDTDFAENTPQKEKEVFQQQEQKKVVTIHPNDNQKPWENQVVKEKEPEPEEGELTVDAYETTTEIVIQSMVAGVRPEDLTINITRDTITIRGKREENKGVPADTFFAKELYWGTFSRKLDLPAEVEPERADAIEKHGLLIIKIPKIDKSKQASIRVKSL